MLNNVIDRIRLHFRKERELYFALYDILGFFPRNITYYKVALMHKSLGHRATPEELKVLEGNMPKRKKGAKDAMDERNGRSENRRGKNSNRGERNGKGRLGKQLNNERLEFLGDAILDAVVGEMVYKQFPGKPEGFLTDTRSKLVKRETLGRLANETGLSNLILSSGRAATHNSYIGGNAFEALVGAVYLDQGYEACRKFWAKSIMGRYLNVEKMAYKEVNFKSKLLEWTQKNRVNIDFKLDEQSHDNTGSMKFVYTVFLETVQGETAEGFSKKESQQKACELTLKKLRHDAAFLDSIFAAKSERTKMEENPTTAAPAAETPGDEMFVAQEGAATAPEAGQDTATQTRAEQEINALTLDDVTATPKEMSREDIIAEAEMKAYEE